MNCPKCGFTQEERADCIKCGVVFAKFMAHYVPEPASPPEFSEPPAQVAGTYEEVQAPDVPDFLELQQNLRDLQKRFSELEFERAERRRIRSEIRALDERLSLIATRQEDAERQLTESASPSSDPSPFKNDLDQLASEMRSLDIPSLRGRLDEVENRLQIGADVFAARTNAPLQELVPDLGGRLANIEERITALVEACSSSPGDETAAQLETVFKTLDELKTGLQNATAGRTEIGELKKYQLMLRDMFESLRQSVEAPSQESANVESGRLTTLENELSALRTEVRKAHDRVKTLETKSPNALQVPDPSTMRELSSLKEEVLAISRLRAEEHEQVRSQMSRLEIEVANRLEGLSQLMDRLETCSSRIQHLDEQYQPLSEIVARLVDAAEGAPKQLAELNREFSAFRTEFAQAKSQVQSLQERVQTQADRPLLDSSAASQGEMCIIRENLDEIRRFMTTLSRKL